LNRLDDIQDVTVNYNTAKLQVSGSSALSLNTVQNEVQKLGYTVEPLEQTKNYRTYDVIGMDCNSCAKSIEKHLSSVSSVQDVNVNFSTGKMKVAHKNSVDDVISEVSKIGYKASLNTGANKSTGKTNHREKYGLITLSGIL